MPCKPAGSTPDTCSEVQLTDIHIIRSNPQVDTSFLAIGAAFPLSFGINAGFTRREKALTVLASLKASVAALYWIHRDWTVYADFSVDKAQSADSKPQAVAVESLLFEFLVCLKNYLKFDSGYESYAEYVQMKRGGGMFASFGLDLDFNKKVRSRRDAALLPGCHSSEVPSQIVCTLPAVSTRLYSARQAAAICNIIPAPILRALASSSRPLTPLPLPPCPQANRSMSSVEMRKQVYNTDLSEYWLYEVYKRLSKLSVLNELMGKTVYCKSGAWPGCVPGAGFQPDRCCFRMSMTCCYGRAPLTTS